MGKKQIMPGLGLWKRALVILLLAAVGLYICGCSNEGEDRKTRTYFVMDTRVDITIYGVDNRLFNDIALEVFAEMERLENIFSRHLPESDVSRINQSAGKMPVEVEPETLYVLQKALDMYEKTGGVFDPTVGPLLELWGFGTENPAVPGSEEISRTLELVDYSAVEIDEEKGTVFLPRQGMKIDLGGIAKGYIVDKGQEVIQRYDVQAAFINAGGDISMSGRKPDEEKWRVAVKNPVDVSGDFADVIEMEEGSVATSGDYERFFEEDGRVYHHILDPATGYPAEVLSSVTIVAADTLTADALSTGIFVIGLEKGLELLEELDGIEGVLIDKEGAIYRTAGL